jgi:hypothetical protein
MINEVAHPSYHAAVAAAPCAVRVGVMASNVSQVPGEKSALGTDGMTIARLGSIGWGPPS